MNGKTIQSYSDISNFLISVSTPDSEYNETLLYQFSDQQIKKLYKNYEKELQNMIAEYGTTPEQKKLMAKQYAKISMPLQYQAKDSWDTMIMYAETYGIVLAVIIGFLASGIFAEEFHFSSIVSCHLSDGLFPLSPTYSILHRIC